MMNWLLNLDRLNQSRTYVRGAEMTHGLPLTAATAPVNPPVETPANLRAITIPESQWRTPARAAAAVAFLACLVWTTPCLAAPSQDDIFKSISSNVDSQNNSGSGTFLAVLLVLAGGVLIVAVWKNRTAGPERGAVALNNQGKLIKELMKSTGLKPGQMRQLRVLADDLEARGQVVTTPLTLLLCPSLLRKAKEEPEER